MFRHRIAGLHALSIAAALAAAVGCADQVKAPHAMRTDPLGAAYPQHVAMEGLHKALVVDRPIVDPSTETRPMQVTVPVRSVVEEPIHVQYRFEFRDDRGRPLRSNTGWRFATIAPRTRAYFESNALETAASDWGLTIQPAR